MTYSSVDGQAVQALHENLLARRWMYSVRNGCSVSINTGNLGQTDTLSVSSGSVFFGGSKVSVASQNVEIASSNGFPRKDVVWVDSNGNATATSGTAEKRKPSGNSRFNSYRPAPPDLGSTNSVILAEVWVPPNSSSIFSDDLVDRRLLADAAIEALWGLDHVENQDIKSSPLSSPDDGDWYIDDGTNTGSGSVNIRVYNNGAWTDVGTASSGSSPETQDDGTTIETATTIFNFGGSDFSVTNPTSGEALIEISPDSISTGELDLSISPTWTGGHTFSRSPGASSADHLTLVNGDTSDQLVFHTDTSDRFVLRTYDNSSSSYRNLWRVNPSSQQLDILGTLNFPNITGTPSFSSHDHSEGGTATVPNAGLTNSSITVTAGDGLKNGGSASLGGSTTLDIEPANFAGSYLSDDGSDNLQVNLGEGLEGDGSNNIKSKEPFVYDPGMTNWADGLSNEEIDRIALQSGETLVIERIEFRQKGGGSSTNASIDVRDTTAATTVGSQTLGGTTKDPGSTGAGNTIIVRINNSTGGGIDAAPRVIGYIEGA